jgi:hypothetical protein
MNITAWHRGRSIAAFVTLGLASIVGATPALADSAQLPDCVAQYVSDARADGSLTIGEIQGHLPDGQAHTFQPFGVILRIQATADHGTCPFTFEP